ncbi:sigma-70 family RNA polymerase sigma factor [Mariniblastus sp.]|nr:sigma-70 family RNA polymerase sigma factor [Mariniblastus sp.]
MFESGNQSLIGSYRHHQSEVLSHQWAPAEFALPVFDSRRIPGTGKGMGQVTMVANERIEFRFSPAQSKKSKRLAAKTKSRQLRPSTCSTEFDFVTESRLLNRDEERKLATQIFRYRQAFQRLALKEAKVLSHLIGLIRQWKSGHLRVDSICNMGLSESQKRKKVEPKLRASIRKLEKLSIQLQTGSSEIRRRSHREIIEIVESLMLRPKCFESAPFQGELAEKMFRQYQMLCQKMMLANGRLVIQVARKLCGNSQILSDMIQEGHCGLIQAVTKFDHQCNVRFSTYATPWIKQAIFGAISNCQRNIRVPENFRASHRKVVRKIEEIRKQGFEFTGQNSGVEISLIADHVKMSVEDVERHFQVQRDTCSLDAPGNRSGMGEASDSSVVSAIADQASLASDSLAIEKERVQRIRKMMAQSLTSREREVISLRFGFRDGSGKSFSEVGREMGLTRQRVCQVEKQALAKLEQVTEKWIAITS